MKIGILVQARMTSQRFPNKVLHMVCGKPMIGYLLDSLSRCSRYDCLALITSDEESDRPLQQYCNARKIDCYRGSLQDVAGRFCAAAQHFGLDAFVRVNGDSPLLDFRVVDQAVGEYLGRDVDLVTNTFPRSFPKGQSVEVINFRTFVRMKPLLQEPADIEHVTRYFYQHPDEYRIHNFASGGDFGALQLSVDTAEDMVRFEKLVSHMRIPHWQYSWREIVSKL